jgi:hypothetical protein
MSRMVIFRASCAELSRAKVEPHFPSGSSSDILAQHLDYSDGPSPEPGDRLPEHCGNGHLQASSSRPGPWRVVAVDEYVGNTGCEPFDSVVICSCEYAPIPDEENLWSQNQLGQVSLDSFGGDAAAYENWKSKQAVLA